MMAIPFNHNQALETARNMDSTLQLDLGPRDLLRMSNYELDEKSREPAQRLTASLVIPARNEARNLAHVLRQLTPCIDEVILVDGHSSDSTKLMAKSCWPEIRIINEPAPGKGEALRAGFRAATGDIVVAMDADGSMSPEEIPLYLSLFEHGFDFVKGSRFTGGGHSLDITTLRRFGNRALVHVANTLFNAGFTDLCYGFFAFRRIFLSELDLKSTGFEIETEIAIRAHEIGLRIAEVPSTELPRREGRSNLHTFRDGKRVLETMIAERFPHTWSRVHHAMGSSIDITRR